MALTWNRPLDTLNESKSPKIAAAIADSEGEFVVSLYVDQATDPDFTTNTIVARMTCVKSVVGNQFKVTCTTRYWDGNDAYVSATNPANSTAITTDQPVVVATGPDLDAFWTTAGFDRVTPTLP